MGQYQHLIKFTTLLSVQHLFGTFSGLIEVSASVQWPLDQLVPAGLDTEQQVFDKNNVLLQAGKAKLRAGLLQSQDLLSVGVHFIHKHLGRQRQDQNKLRKNVTDHREYITLI